VFTPVFSGLRFTQTLVLCVCFVDRCLSFCTFSFGHFNMLSVLRYIYIIRIMITTLVSSNSSSVRLYLQLFVGGSVSYLRYLCVFPYSGVQHILCCVFVLFFFVSCTVCCHFSGLCIFVLPLRYSLTFIIFYN